MSGELTIKRSGGWRKAEALGITAVLILLIMLPMARVLSTRLQTGLMTQFGIAILVPVLIWLLYPQMMKLLPGDKGNSETLRWTIRDGVLILGETAIPQKSIKMVYCWEKDGDWTVNIETTGKNQLLRSVEGDARSVRQLYALVDALGFRSQWREI